MPGFDGLSVVEEFCLPPFVPVPKPGPCKGWKTPEFRERRARLRQATIDDARKRADVLAELEELANNETGAEAIGRSMRRFVDAAGLDGDEQASALIRVAQRGDREALDKALDRLARRFGVRRAGGRAGQTVGFDPGVHDMIAGERRPARGARVDVVRPGYVMRLDGKVVPLMKAVVEPVG